MDLINAQASLFNSPLFLVVIIWSMFWKALGLWHSARNDQKNWFITMFIINIVGLIEISYLFFFAKKRMKIEDLMFWNNKK